MYYRILIFLIFFIGMTNALKCDAQVLLQLEIFKEIDAVKFGPGDQITYKTKAFPKDWQTKKLKRIITGDDILVFEDGMVNLSEITQFRLRNGTAAGMGKLFTGFGAGWFLFGGIAHFASDYKFTWGSFAIGAVATGVGWLLNKVVSKRTFKIGKTANLRIIDISFPAPADARMQSNSYP